METLGLSAVLSFRTCFGDWEEGCEYRGDVCLASSDWLGGTAQVRFSCEFGVIGLFLSYSLDSCNCNCFFQREH